MLSRFLSASVRRRSRGSSTNPLRALSPAHLGDVLPPLQWDRLFSSDTPEGGDEGEKKAFEVVEKKRSKEQGDGDL